MDAQKEAAARAVEHMRKVVAFPLTPPAIQIEAICEAVAALAAVVIRKEQEAA